MDKQLKEAVNRQIYQNNATTFSTSHTPNKGPKCYDVRISGTHNHDDYIEMLNKLPNLMNDTEKIGTILGGLLGIIAQQQQELLDLRNLVYCALLDKTKVEIEKNFTEHIEKLTKDKDIKDVEFNSSVKITSENQNTEDYQFDEKSKQINSLSINIGGGLKGLLDLLVSLEMGGNADKTSLNETINKISEKTTNSQRLHYEGSINSKYGEVKKPGWFK